MNNESNSYFSVKHRFSAYLSPWPESQPLPSESELKAMLPLGLQLISEVKSMEANCLLQLRNLDDEARTVVEYLKLQSRKIDLVLQHILEQQPNEGDKCIGKQFGGSGICIISATQLNIGQQYRVILHIKEALISMLCIAQCTESIPINQPETQAPAFECLLEFSQVLDEDIEQLVKASLNVQQKQLQQRKKDNQAKSG